MSNEGSFAPQGYYDPVTGPDGEVTDFEDPRPLYRVSTNIGVTVFVRDGKVTGVDPDQGWSEPSVSVEREGQDEIDLPINSDEVDDVLRVLTGRWEVREAAPAGTNPTLVSWVTDDLEANIWVVNMTQAQADDTLARIEAKEYADPYVTGAKPPISYEDFQRDCPDLFEDDEED